MTDGELVRQSLTGDRAAAEQLVRRWSVRVLAVCRSRVRRLDVAEEMAQEALYRAYKGLGTLSEPEKFGGWVCGIATRVCLDYLKARERTTVTFSGLGGDIDPAQRFADAAGADHIDALAGQEQRERLLEEVRQLPEKHREALMLYYCEDCTYQQLGDLLGVSAATINARLTQARQMLRARLLADEADSDQRRALLREIQQPDG